MFQSSLYCCLILYATVSGKLLDSDKKSRTDSKIFQDDDKSLISDLILGRIMSLYSPTSSPDPLCSNHSTQYTEGVKDFELWALKMFDSSTKIPDGVLAGMINQMGNFDECVGVAAPATARYGAFTGKHCYALLYPTAPVSAVTPGTPADSYLLHMLRGYMRAVLGDNMRAVLGDNMRAVLGDNMRAVLGDNMRAVLGDGAAEGWTRGKEGDAKFGDLSEVAPEGYGLRWSFCVPSSCAAADVADHLTNGLAALGLAARVTEADCHTADARALTAVDWVAIFVLCLLCSLAILSTAYDVLTPDPVPGRKYEMLVSFSVYRNGRRLMDTTPATGSDVLSAVNGIRVVSIAWVMYCHRWALSSAYPSPALDFAADFVVSPQRMYILNGALSVDSFFLLSGMLVSYIYLKEMTRGTSFNVPLYYLHRYIRLTPPLAMMILMQVSLLAHAGSGPLWSWAEWYVKACQKNWWVTMLYVQNYVHRGETCIPVSWYLAADTHLYLLSPLVLIPLWKWPRVGKPLLGFWIAFGFAVAFTLPFVNYEHANSQRSQEKTHRRLPVWLIGVALGYMLHHTKNKQVVINKWLVLVIWLFSLFLTFGTVYLLAPFQQRDYEYQRFWDAFYTAYYRPAFAVGLAWVIFACARGYGGFINTMLSHSFFVPMARLSFGIYLVHMTVQETFLGAMKVPMHFHDSVIVPLFFSDMVISTGFAACLYLLVEAPCIVIEKALLGKARTREPALPTADAPESVSHEDYPEIPVPDYNTEADRSSLDSRQEKHLSEPAPDVQATISDIISARYGQERQERKREA